MLASGSEGNPELNTYANFVVQELLPSAEKIAMLQANEPYAGEYTASNGVSNSNIVVQVDGKPGLVATDQLNNGTDVLAGLPKLNGIKPEAMIFGLCPSNEESGDRKTWKAVWQDDDAFADAGTPTCVSWMDTEKFIVCWEVVRCIFS
jgi:hypothetical protein